MAGKDAGCRPVKVVVMDPAPLGIPKVDVPLGKGTIVDDVDCAADPTAAGRVYFDSGDARVVASQGQDVTAAFVGGARRALAAA